MQEKLKIVSFQPAHVLSLENVGQLQGGSPPLGQRFVFRSQRNLVFDGPERIADFEFRGNFHFQVHPTRDIIVAQEYLTELSVDLISILDFHGKTLYQIRCERYLGRRESSTQAVAGFEGDGSFFLIVPQDISNSKIHTWPANTPIESLGDFKLATDSFDFGYSCFILEPPTLPGWRTVETPLIEDCHRCTNFRTVDGKVEIAQEVTNDWHNSIAFSPDDREYLAYNYSKTGEMVIEKYSRHEGERQLETFADWPYDDPEYKFDRDFPSDEKFYLNSKWAIFRTEFLNRIYLLNTESMRFVAELEIEGFELGLVKTRIGEGKTRPDQYRFYYAGEYEGALCSYVEQILRCDKYLVARCVVGTKEKPTNQLAFIELEAIIAALERSN